MQSRGRVPQGGGSVLGHLRGLLQPPHRGTPSRRQWEEGGSPPASLGDLRMARVASRGAVPTVSPVFPKRARERAGGPCRLGCRHRGCLCVGPRPTPRLHPGDPGQGEPCPAPLQAAPEETLGQHCHAGTGGAQGPGTPAGVGCPRGCEIRAWAAPAPAGRDMSQE